MPRQPVCSCVRLYMSGLYHYYWDHLRERDDIILEGILGFTREERVVKTMLISLACHSNVLKKLKCSMPVFSNLDDYSSFLRGTFVVMEMEDSRFLQTEPENPHYSI